MNQPLPTFMELERPEFLFLLLLIPLVVLIGYRSLSSLGRFRQVSALIMRSLTITAIAIALSEPYWVRTTDDQTVIFALDFSDSIPEEQQEEAFRFVHQAAREMRAGKDRIACIGFAGQPTMWQPPDNTLNIDDIPITTMHHQTDLASALKMSLAMFPPDTARRLVMITDGNENHGVSQDAIQTYATFGIPIDILPMRYNCKSEILVDRLTAPSSMHKGEVADLQLFIHSQRRTQAHIHLFHNDSIVDLTEDENSTALAFQLEKGANRFSIPIRLNEEGIHQFQVMVQPEDKSADALTANNQGRAFTLVGEAERVIVLSGSTSGMQAVSDAQVICNALKEAGIEADIIPISDFHVDPLSLVNCSTLILSNLSAFTLGEPLQKLIVSYVRDQGGGLIVIGGDESFSVGGYGNSPLEEVLPVKTDRDRLKLLSLSMVIVIDRSGSMMGDKLAMARRAAQGAVDMLGSLDHIGVMAFDGAPYWAVPLCMASDKAAIKNKIAGIQCGGGTNMYPAIEEGYTRLLLQNTNLKHMIVLTDGQSMPGDFKGIAHQCHDAGITISTIAVGPDADRKLLSAIASITKGRMYLALNAKPLPQIFVHETILASRSGLYERPFVPQFIDGLGERVLTGFTQEDIPPLQGYVITAAKPMATTPLVRQNEDVIDPILAYWQIGLGKTVAFTSGFWSRWGPQWTRWPGFSKLWAQAVRYTGRTSNPSDLEVETSIQNGEGRIVISGEHFPREDQLSLSLRGAVIQPDSSTQPLTLNRTRLGLFEGTFPADQPGTYLVNVAYSMGYGQEQTSGTLRTGVVVSYSPEYATLTEDDSTLTHLSSSTGGRTLMMNYPEAVFEPWSIRPFRVRRPIWDILIRIALPLLLLDVAVRRLAFTPVEVYQRFIGWLGGLAGIQAGSKSVATLATLQKARNKNEEMTITGGDETFDPGAVWDQEPDETPSQPLIQKSERHVQAKPQTQPAPEEAADQNTLGEHTSRLLRAKRRLYEDDPKNPDDSV